MDWVHVKQVSKWIEYPHSAVDDIVRCSNDGGLQRGC